VIHLGYETGTARPVSIPLAHMAVTGQTQQSGKTTTLEALIHRGNLRAVVFVTKPGEKSFTEGRRILPLFKEHADWEYVKELLEARRAESLSKWDGYLMRVCARAHTLKDVRANIEKELPKKKSARPSHYEVLAGYLDLIIPELDRVEYTDKLEIVSGVNIMDLAEMSEEMQSMVIRSTIEQIHQREHNTVLVIPEAWKFIPEGGRSAVFQTLHALIREGATNKNFVWIDAQDLAIVSKRILKSVTVWILGKQQEANEVTRTINHLIEPLQIRPDMIKSLGIGQFLVCADSLPARRIYVQPAWLGELDAQAIARGEESIETAQAIFVQKKRELAADRRTSIAFSGPRGSIVPRLNPEIDDALGTPAQWRKDHPAQAQRETHEKENRTETGKSRILPTARQGRAADPVRLSPALPAPHGDSEPGNQSHGNTAGNEATPAVMPEAGSHSRDSAVGNEDAMYKERAEKAEADVKQLQAEVLGLRKLLNEYRDGEPIPDFTALPASVAIGIAQIYAEVKLRAQNDPGILQLLASRPELRVQIEPKVLEVDGSSLRGGLALLIHRGFFAAPKNGNTTWTELQRLGRRTAKPNVYRELDNLAEMGFLTKEPDGFQATDLKVSVKK
jgi:hypothetical protein